jgi:hypothetical protein
VYSYIKIIQTLKNFGGKFKFFGGFADTILLGNSSDPSKSFQTFPTKKFHLHQVIDQNQTTSNQTKKTQSTAKKIM